MTNQTHGIIFMKLCLFHSKSAKASAVQALNTLSYDYDLPYKNINLEFM